MTQTGLYHDGHLEEMFFYMENKKFHPKTKRTKKVGIDKAAERFIKGTGQVWFYIGTKGDQKRLVIRGVRNKRTILKDCHDNPATGGHNGYVITQNKIEASYYWLGITADVENWIKKCDHCQHVGHFKTVAPELQPIKTDGCHQVWEVDLIGPFRETASGMRYCCTMIDLFSRFLFVEAIPSKEASVVVQVVQNIMYLYPHPGRIITDQGREFNNEITSHVFDVFGKEHFIISAYHPQVNGQDEITNQSIKRKLIKHANDAQNDWDVSVLAVVYKINRFCQRSMEYTPFEIFFKRKP